MFEKVSHGSGCAGARAGGHSFLERKQHLPDVRSTSAKAATYSRSYDGPPTANGKPHIGHIETRAIKDLIPRYQTMKGKKVLRKAGWDTHGLPVELEVEKLLGLDGKEQIEQYGIEPFIQECKKSVWKYKGEWERMSERVGYWADMEHPYITYDNNYIESDLVVAEEDRRQGSALQGPQDRALLPALRHRAFQPRGLSGLQGRHGALRRRPLQGRRRGEHLHLRLDDHALDAAQQRRAVRQTPTRPTRSFDCEGRTVIMGDALIEKILGEKEITNKTTFPGSELVGMRL